MAALRGGEEVADLSRRRQGLPCLSWVQSQFTWDFKQLISPICKTISFRGKTISLLQIVIVISLLILIWTNEG